MRDSKSAAPQLRELLAAPALKPPCAGRRSRRRSMKHGVRQEQAAQAGLAHIRRARADGHDYFFANLGGEGVRRLAAAGRFRRVARCCSIR